MKTVTFAHFKGQLEIGTEQWLNRKVAGEKRRT